MSIWLGLAFVLTAFSRTAAAEPPLTVQGLMADGWEIAGYASGYDNRTSLILFRHPGVNALVQCGVLFDVMRSPRTIVNCYESSDGEERARLSTLCPPARLRSFRSGRQGVTPIFNAIAQSPVAAVSELFGVHTLDDVEREAARAVACPGVLKRDRPTPALAERKGQAIPDCSKVRRASDPLLSGSGAPHDIDPRVVLALRAGADRRLPVLSLQSPLPFADALIWPARTSSSIRPR